MGPAGVLGATNVEGTARAAGVTGATAVPGVVGATCVTGSQVLLVSQVLWVPQVLQLSQMPLMQGEAERSHEGAGFGVPALTSRLGAGWEGGALVDASGIGDWSSQLLRFLEEEGGPHNSGLESHLGSLQVQALVPP